MRRPYRGKILERATPHQRHDGFRCNKIGFVQRLPQQWEVPPAWLQEQHLEQYLEHCNFTPQSSYDDYNVFERGGKPNADEILSYTWSVTPQNCHWQTHEELHLKGDLPWGAERQFENEALTAVCTANFISTFLQVVDPKELFPGTRVIDAPLNEDQMIGEAPAIVMGNTRVYSTGIYWEANMFDANPMHFTPYAYQTQLNTTRFQRWRTGPGATTRGSCTPSTGQWPQMCASVLGGFHAKECGDDIYTDLKHGASQRRLSRRRHAGEREGHLLAGVHGLRRRHRREKRLDILWPRPYFGGSTFGLAWSCQTRLFVRFKSVVWRRLFVYLTMSDK